MKSYLLLLAILATIITPSLSAQDTLMIRALSLDEAVRLGAQQSEAIKIARSGVKRAQGQIRQARSQAFPQIYGSAGYTKTLKSQFDGFGSAPDTSSVPVPPAPCGQYILGPTGTELNRILGLERYVRCSGSNGPFSNLSSVGFGAENQYNMGLAFSQTLFSGGKVFAANNMAKAARRTAEIELDAQSAQLILDITQAYYDAALADRLLAIAETSYEQTQEVFRQTELNKNVGTVSEFELLRAQVTRDNQMPIVIQRRSDREVAYLRLKQMLEMPLETPLQLTTAIEDTTVTPPGVRIVTAATADTAASNRATVQQAAENVTIQKGLVRVAKAQRWPALSLTSQYGRVAYPQSGIPGWSDFRNNWTVGVGGQIPFFTGGRISGDVMIAQADLNIAKERLQQTKEFAALDAHVALNALKQAEAAYKASVGTTRQAERAYSIALVRYKEGISTQLEVNDARLLVDQARANHALAARNLQIARVKLVLLPDLPLQGAAQSSSQQQSQSLQQLPSQPQRQSSQQAQGAGAFSGASAGAQPQSQ